MNLAAAKKLHPSIQPDSHLQRSAGSQGDPGSLQTWRCVHLVSRLGLQ